MMRFRNPFQNDSPAKTVAAFAAGALVGAAAAVAITELLKRRAKQVAVHSHPMLNGDGPGPTTPSTSKHHAADSHMGTPGHNEEERLDEALKESFPTSDPVSIQVA
jgi:ribosomal protein S12 methylthiotransferase accessory factor YcaO